jgi:DNA repair protein RadD
LTRTRQALRRSKRVLVQLPTGGGKTAIGGKALANAVGKGNTCWFMLHRRELVKQSVVTLTDSANLPLGIVAAGFPGNRHQPVQVCSIGTVGRRLDLLPEPSLLLWDEAHHLAASSWAAIMAKFPDAYHIGLSATPERLDGAGLNRHFDEMVCGPSVRELIDAGWLSDYVLYRPTNLDLSGVHTLGGDYNKKELAAAMSRSTVTGDALTHYRKFCPGARAILFAWSIEASQDLVRQFNAAGIPAEHVDGGTDDVTRDNAIQNFKAGRTLLLSNVNLFSEGFDVPAVEAVFDLAPTKSLAMYLQRCGRALRPAPGKTQALLFDHANNSKMHGLPDADRTWSLEGRKTKSRGGDGPPTKQCPLCFAWVSGAASICRHCNYKFATQAREIEQVEGELSPVERQRVDAMVKDQRLAESSTT